VRGIIRTRPEKPSQKWNQLQLKIAALNDKLAEQRIAAMRVQLQFWHIQIQPNHIAQFI
jgi:hypothetical protein